MWVWHGGGWMWIWGAVMMAFWVLIVAVAVVWVVRALQSGPSRDRDAEDVLAQRYARGEINSEEFHDRLDGLRSRR